MDVVIVWCKECVFSQNALTGIRSCLDKMAVGRDGQEGILLKSHCFDLHDLHHHTIAVTVRKAKVRMVILTHFFLDRLRTSTVKSSCQIHLNRILYSEGVIAILTGVRQQDITDNYLEFLPHFTSWNILELKSNRKPDNQFFKSFSEQVIRSYNMNTRHNEASLRPSSLVNGHGDLLGVGSGVVSGYKSMQNLDLTCNCDPDTQKLTIKIRQKIQPLDEVTLQIRSGDVNYVGVIQIPCETSTRDEIHVEIPLESSAVTPLVVHQEDDPIDAMILKFPGYKKYLDEQIADKLLLCFETGKSIENVGILDEMCKGKADYFPTLMHFAAYYGLEQTVLNLLEKGNGLELCEIENKFGDTPLILTTRRGYGATIGQTMRDYEELMLSWKAIQYIHQFYEGIDAEATEVEPNLPEDAESAVTVTDADNALNNEVDGETSPRKETPDTKNPILSLTEETDDSVAPGGPALPVKPPRAAPPKPKTIPNISEYDYPPHARPITNYYDVPPSARPVRPPKKRNVLEKKDGTIKRGPDNYISVIGRTTLPRNRPDRLSLRKSLSSITTSSDEEPDEYHKVPPKPQIPSVSRSSVISTTDSSPNPNRSSLVVIEPQPGRIFPLDSKNEELRQLMEQVKAKMIDLNDLDRIFSGWKRRSDVKQDIAERQKELKRIREEYDAAQIRRSTKDVNFLERVTAIFRGRKKTTPPLQISSPTLISTELSSSTPPQQLTDFVWPQPQSASKEGSDVANVRRPSAENHSIIRSGSDRRRIGVSYNDTPLALPETPVVEPQEPVVLQTEAVLELTEQCLKQLPEINEGNSNAEKPEPDFAATVELSTEDSGVTHSETGYKVEAELTTEASEIHLTAEGQGTANVTLTFEENLTPPPRPPKRRERAGSSPKKEQVAESVPVTPEQVPAGLSNPNLDQPSDCPPSPKPRRNPGMKLQYINYGNVDQPPRPLPAENVLRDAETNGPASPDYENQTSH